MLNAFTPRTGAPQVRDLIDYKPVLLKVIEEESVLEILEDANLFPVATLLRKGPMTVQEIVDVYNQPKNDIEAKKKAEGKRYQTIFGVTSKSDKTIYRYLNTLEEVGVVVHGGQRISEKSVKSSTDNKTRVITEKLYMRSAHIFERKNREWMSKKGDDWAKHFGLSINRMIDGENSISIECIKKFFDKWDSAKTNALKKLAVTVPDDKVPLSIVTRWQDVVEFMDRVYIVGTLMNHPELLEELRNCFQK